MSGQGKISDLKNKYRVLSANAQTYANWTYHITTASTITLPDSAALSVGAWVKFTKKQGVVPTIQRFGSTVNIKLSDGTLDSAVFYDIDSEIKFVWNGIEWEV